MFQDKIYNKGKTSMNFLLVLEFNYVLIKTSILRDILSLYLFFFAIPFGNTSKFYVTITIFFLNR